MRISPSPGGLHRALLVLLASIVGGPGCGAVIAFHYGEPPIAPSAGDSAAKCTFRKRIVVRRAALTWNDHHRLGNVVLITGGRTRGLSFYQGSKLVTADTVLTAVGDQDLAKAYRKLYAKDFRSYRTGMIVGWSMMGTALLTSVIGGGLMADQYISSRGRTQMITGATFLGVSVLAFVIGAIELGLGYGARGVVESYENLFLARSYESRMIEAVRRYNAKAASECSGGASPE
jgi:hypothetical protein